MILFIAVIKFNISLLYNEILSKNGILIMVVVIILLLSVITDIKHAENFSEMVLLINVIGSYGETNLNEGFTEKGDLYDCDKIMC